MPTETTTEHTYPYRWTREVVDYPERGERAVLLWVCIDCMMQEASGEKQETHDHDGTPCVPWSTDQDGATMLTPGRLTETVDPGEREHFHDPDTWTEGYETVGFSRERCDGCGCGLAGSRHAYTAWYPLG